jgi:serine---pyruvate transaminase
MPGKQYLMTPGPTPVPPQVLAVLSEPVVHHRGPDFLPIYERCLDRLRAVYRSTSEPLLFTASGTGAMESVLANLTQPGDAVVVVSAGSFGERWLDLARTYGCDVEHSLRYEWGETPSADDLAARLARAGDVKLVLLTHSETSTGVVADVRALAAEAREAGAFVAVDAVSSLGAVPLETDAWGLDAVVSGSQKALMTPPGLAFVALSERAERVAALSTRSFYFDWTRNRHAQDRRDSAFTPAVSLVRALEVALGLLLDGGLEDAFERHRRLGRACREGVKAMGLDLFSPDDDSSAVVTAVRIPEGYDSSDLVRSLRERFGITIANGQGELKGKIFRIGHIGYYDVFDVTTALAALEVVLDDLGVPIDRGGAASRALEAYEGATRV